MTMKSNSTHVLTVASDNGRVRSDETEESELGIELQRLVLVGCHIPNQHLAHSMMPL